MAKIIPFKKISSESRPRTTTTTNADARSFLLSAMGDLEASGALEGTGIEISPIIRIQKHLASLRGQVSKQSIVDGRNMVRNSTTEELCAIARVSTPDQWSARPGYFQALVDEITSRD